METLESIKEKLSDLRMQEMRLEQENFQTRLKPLVQSAIGKTFAYRNNSSGGSERWDVFKKVKAVVFTEYHAWVLCEECQLRTDSGVPELTIHSDLLSRDTKEFPRPDMGWKACPVEEFERAKQAVLEQLENPTMACEKIRSDH
jgi:hypothetical protein